MAARELIVAITGASGAVYAGRLLRALLQDGHHVHLVMSQYGRYLLTEELGYAPDAESILDFLNRLYGDGVRRGSLRQHRIGDLASPLASGSGRVHGMAVVPCSMKTLAGIAHGLSTNLIERAADVTLKERRPLVLVPRETPLSLVHLRNLAAVAEAGGTLVPAMPAFYQRPVSFDDLGDFIAGRVLDVMGIEHELYPRWEGPSREP
jgi:4-hydroxy-3-polyprenylbenzoate decarboxylase